MRLIVVAYHYKPFLPGFNDLATTRPEIAMEWNYAQNGKLNPNSTSGTSNKKVWWKCSVCGGEWSAAISSRVRGMGCPYCVGKKTVKEE